MGLIDPSNGKIEIDNFNLQKIKNLGKVRLIISTEYILDG